MQLRYDWMRSFRRCPRLLPRPFDVLHLTRRAISMHFDVQTLCNCIGIRRAFGRVRCFVL